MSMNTLRCIRRVRWCLLAALMLGGAAALRAAPVADKVPDTIAQRLQACTTCHGKEGRATNEGYFPRIAGKPAGYLYNQLVNFREGRRSNAAMTYLVEHMSDEYLRQIADYFAGLELPYPPSRAGGATSRELARGEELVHRGDAARRIPACVQCHGASMTGVAPVMPGLLGLPREYLIAQFGSWRSGQRKALAPDCMADISARLSAEDVSALAHWLSAQPLPMDSKPAREIALPLPMACGSTDR
jgi:cytochrome c553